MKLRNIIKNIIKIILSIPVFFISLPLYIFICYDDRNFVELGLRKLFKEDFNHYREIYQLGGILWVLILVIILK